MKNFTASNFQGECIVDEDFIPYLEQMNEILKQFNFTLIVTSSFRKDTNVKGAIVTPAQMSNHLVGHAIDCNLKDNKTGEYFNSTKMADGKGDDENVIKMLEKIPNLRWGGEFKERDVVHFDDALNLRNSTTWRYIYNTYHK